MVREAVDALIDAGEFTKARRVARELEPRLEPYVEQRYKDHLQNQGQFDELVNVDLERALKVLVDQGEWERAIETAGEHGPDLKHKYVALQATRMIQERDARGALDLYKRHGTPAKEQNFNIYKRVAVDLFALPAREDEKGKLYSVWANLRDMLLDLTEAMARTGDTDGTAAHEDFKLLLRVSHYLATRSACRGAGEALAETAAKLSAALLRHSDLVPADKAFYEAGKDARAVGWNNMAFVFFNR
jgi:intraflagellar transport protein 172